MLPDLDSLIDNEDISLWGKFFGLFGLGSNELIVVTYGAVSDVNERLNSLDSVDSVATLLLVPTARPTTDEQRTKEGLYVFRRFAVNHKDVEEIADLSKEAWKSFENTDEYQAIPQALFCQGDRSQERGTMLLVTWYDGLNSWQTSRTPPGNAGENFRRRGQITLSTTATATRLLT